MTLAMCLLQILNVPSYWASAIYKCNARIELRVFTLTHIYLLIFYFGTRSHQITKLPGLSSNPKSSRLSLPECWDRVMGFHVRLAPLRQVLPFSPDLHDLHLHPQFMLLSPICSAQGRRSVFCLSLQGKVHITCKKDSELFKLIHKTLQILDTDHHSYLISCNLPYQISLHHH